VSLVPSQTELLYDLGLDREVVGITRFCIHPQEWFRSKTRVGGTKNPKLEVIRGLQPDLILANKEENRREDIEALRSDFQVYTTDINTLTDALDMVKQVGVLTGTTNQAELWVQQGLEAMNRTRSLAAQTKALYVIWAKPWMAVGNSTFIGDFLQHVGFVVLAPGEGRYPAFVPESLNPAPDVVLLSSEPFPFADKHLAQWHSLYPQAKIALTDGEAWSWYGTRWIKKAPETEALVRRIIR
jgi:ABC-type Fe3+-hydroxamate transport system substrate-binding protein